MGTKFEREERYLVFKLADVEKDFFPSEISQLLRLYETQQNRRKQRGKPPLECVVVEKDWPEYEPTWKAIEARVTGAQSVPEESAIQTAARVMNIELIRERDELRAKIEAMERQEPAGKFIQHPSNGLWEQDGYGDNPDARPLYALPGAKGE